MFSMTASLPTQAALNPLDCSVAKPVILSSELESASDCQPLVSEVFAKPNWFSSSSKASLGLKASRFLRLGAACKDLIKHPSIEPHTLQSHPLARACTPNDLCDEIPGSTTAFRQSLHALQPAIGKRNRI